MDGISGNKHLTVPKQNDLPKNEPEVSQKKSAVLRADFKELRATFLPKYEKTRDNLGKLGFANALVIKLKAFKDMLAAGISPEAYSKSKAEGKKQLLESRVTFMKEFESVGSKVERGTPGAHFGDPLVKTALSSKDPLLLTMQLEKLVGMSTEDFGDHRKPVFSVNKFLEGVTDMKVLLGLTKGDVDVSVMEGLRDKLQQQAKFDPDRAVLAQAVDLLLLGLDREIDRETTHTRFLTVADESIKQQSEGTFLRSNDSSVTAIRGLINLTEGGTQLLRDISDRMANLTQLDQVNVLAKSLAEKKDLEGNERSPVTSLKLGIKQTEVDGIFSFVNTVLDSLENLEVSPEVRTTFERLADNIRGRIGAQENGLTREQAKEQVRSLYTSSIFLREVSPSLTNPGSKTVGRPVMNMASIVIQNYANGKTTLSDGGSPDPYAKQKHLENAPAMMKKMEDFLVNKFGMPVEVRLT